ncbi:recombinase family protein [Tropicimonas sp. IMCC6043]|uniref:recombinase family protein n=1 Tax=Tropicimonas sp. IMCC6043 TaxID=2510645 RepID=UPI00101B65A3|nr:recombinase family protein [Tropicimonas sp. IMCC6043]RYH06154.1 hypothetical protein EU800_24850 [Tropicimonas sp. IMCC6043]
MKLEQSWAVTLSNPNGAAALRRAAKGGDALREPVVANSDEHAKALAHVVRQLQDEGHTTLRGFAAELNARGMRTRRGGRWHVSTVMNFLRRIA